MKENSITLEFSIEFYPHLSPLGINWLRMRKKKGDGSKIIKCELPSLPSPIRDALIKVTHLFAAA